MADGFLGRWSRRKLDTKEGREVEAEPVEALPTAEPPTQPVAPAPPPPTLEDVKALTPESDFTRFAARDVTPDVKNAAMKKLFTDPRYNVMDGMDVYIDDYARPDPLPDAMLRQLASAKFLGLFDEKKPEEAAAPPARDVADNPKAQSVAQSQSAPAEVPEPPDHADPDLRLQPDHAAAGKDPGPAAA
ncbi:MAG TPA: DUF3306 domain-containing protein [Ramlibacter sp.]|nr:DUF3306 domain-containing protein [Ramlibacter sp.]